MRHYSLNAIEKLKNLHSFLYTDEMDFHPEKMIIDLGLYDTLLIDTSDIEIKYSNLEAHSKSDPVKIVSKVEVSKDVKALHDFISFTNSLLLPCPECNRTLAFLPKQMTKKAKKKDSEARGYEPVRVGIGHYNVFEPTTLSYEFGCNEFKICGGDRTDVYSPSGVFSCTEGIIDNASVFQRYFECSLESNHRLFIDCIIYRAIDVCKKPKELLEFEEKKKVNPSLQMTDAEKKISDRYEKLRSVLIIEKVGQEPSMADLQMFDIEKYKSILTKERFRDFSMAIGLYASGVGCGSLLYLRRIFESIVITAQLECEKHSEWDKDLYESKRFNEKIDYLESLGNKIIPDELSDVKTKIYGFLSKGVHELSEQEAKELFPHLKLAIELILDEQIAQKERIEKIKTLKSTLNKKI